MPRFTVDETAYERWPPSCWTLKPMPAMAQASDAADSRICQGCLATNTNTPYDPTSQIPSTAVLTHRAYPP
jgi:hypothetical protein